MFAAAWLVPALMAALALASRIHGLGSKPLWYDEVLTLKRAALPLADLLADSFHNKHYPLYFLLTKPFATADWSEAWLRLPAAVLGAAAGYFAARIAHDMAGRWAALATGVLMAMAPLEVQFGQEARPYTLASASILMGLWGLLRLVGLPTHRSSDTRRSESTAWLLYASGMAISLNSLGAAAPCFIATNMIVAIYWMSGRLLPHWSMRRWLLVNLGVLVVWLPSLVWLLHANAVAPTRGLNWIPPLSLDLAGNVVAALYLLRVTDLLTFEPVAASFPFAGLAVMVLVALGAARVAHSSTGSLLIFMTLVMPVTLSLISIAKPLFIPRYLL